MTNIQHMSLEDIMGERFGRYSKYIIQERALPDIRDGLKPVQRRILYSMNKDGNTFDKGYRKSAKSVGNIMGNFHPHGDSSIYDAMVRMSQDWKNREILVEMHGNNGSMDGDRLRLCVIPRRVCRRLQAISCRTLTRRPCLLLGTLTIQKKNQRFSLLLFQIFWSTVRQGFLLGMPRTFHRTIWQKSLTLWSI